MHKNQFIFTMEINIAFFSSLCVIFFIAFLPRKD